MLHRLLLLAAWVSLLPTAALRADDAEDQAVTAVEKLGGKVVRDESGSGSSVVKVDLSFTKVTDAGLKELTVLTGLRELHLAAKAMVTDAGVAEFNKALPECKITRRY